MQYMKLNDLERGELMRSLSAMNEFLHNAFDGLTPEQARTPGPRGAFAPVEQVWHLADLEHEGFGLRIRRLQAEERPSPAGLRRHEGRAGAGLPFAFAAGGPGGIRLRARGQHRSAERNRRGPVDARRNAGRRG